MSKYIVIAALLALLAPAGWCQVAEQERSKDEAHDAAVLTAINTERNAQEAYDRARLAVQVASNAPQVDVPGSDVARQLSRAQRELAVAKVRLERARSGLKRAKAAGRARPVESARQSEERDWLKIRMERLAKMEANKSAAKAKPKKVKPRGASKASRRAQHKKPKPVTPKKSSPRRAPPKKIPAPKVPANPGVPIG